MPMKEQIPHPGTPGFGMTIRGVFQQAVKTQSQKLKILLHEKLF
jgi:hypothetical protein